MQPRDASTIQREQNSKDFWRMAWATFTGIIMATLTLGIVAFLVNGIFQGMRH